MRRKQKKLRAIGLLLGLLLGTSLFAYPTVYATEGEVFTEEPVVLTSVDTSKGVTYVYSDTDNQTPSGINLNGNSIIIVASENSTDENLLNNIYIDKNMDGKIDGGDEQISLDDSVDINANLAIYGVYKQKTTTPISITVNSGYSPAIFGVYEGESDVQTATEGGLAAVTITINGGTVSSAVFGAQNSTVTTDGVSASVLTINDGVVHATVAATMSSKINTTGATALVVHVNGGTVSNTVFGASGSEIISEKAGAIETIMNSQSETRVSTFISANNCTIKVKDSESVGVYAKVSNGSVGTFEAVYGSTAELTDCTASAVLGVVENGSFGNVSFVYGSTVKSDATCNTLIDIDVSGGNISLFKGVVYSDVDSGKNSNTVVDIDVTGTAILSGSAYIVGGSDSWSQPNKDYTFVGNVDVKFDFKALPESGSNINSGYMVNSGAVIDGNVSITFNNTRLGNVYGLYNAYVKGNYVFDIKDTCDLTSSVYAGYNPKIDGNATIDLIGAKSSSYVTVYGFSGKYKSETTLVGGDVVINYNGGTANSFYGLYGSSVSGNYITVGKSITVNVNGGTLNSGYGVEYISANGAVKVFIKNTTLTGYVYTVYNVDSGSDITVDVINNKNAEADYAYLYGANYINAAGNVSVHVDGGYYRGVQGVYGYGSGNTIGGDVDVAIKNVNEDSTSYQNGNYSYGVYGCSVVGKTTVTIDDSNFYTLYGTYETSSQGDVTVDISNVKSYYSLYGASLKDCAANVTSTVENVTANYVYGVYIYGNCGGDITSTINDATASQCIYGMQSSNSYVTSGDVNIHIKGSTCSNGYVYGISNGTIQGNTVVTIEDGDFGSDNNYGGYIYGVSYANTLGETTVNLTDIDMVGSLYPYQSAGSTECADAYVNMTGLTMSTGSNTSVSLCNNTSEGQHITTVIDDTSVIPENTYINPSSSNTGRGTLTYKDHLYYGGKIVFSEDVTYKNLHLNSGNYLIPKGVTVTVEDKLYCNYGYILVEGTLDATLEGTLNADGTIVGTYVYMNGGTLTEDLDKIQYVYYPFDVEYMSEGGTVTKTTSTTLATHALRPSQYFVQVGATVSYKVNANKGYSVIGATVKTEKANAPVDAAVSGNTYSFVMEDSPTTFNVEFKGNQIVVGKTVADPIVKSGTKYTDENPAYDLSTISVSNDADKGEVTYTVDTENPLPEGLTIENNKIVGTTTQVNETGKKAVIQVTGKNGSVANVALNVVVTEGEGTQTNQEGRISVDEANSVIYLNGNSVVMETLDSQTAIYMDDNRDGLADNDTPAYVGDLTTYTMYGVRNTDAKSKIRITINGGTIGTLYVADDATLLPEDDALDVTFNGGSVAEFYGLYNATTQGSMKVVRGSDATIKTYLPYYGNYQYGGYYYDYNGNVTVSGTYVIRESITPPTLTIQGTVSLTKDIAPETLNVYGDLIIDKGIKVSATKLLNRYSGSEIFVKGTLEAASLTTATNTCIYVQGGIVPTDDAWSYVYYPATISTNLKNTNLSFTSNYRTLIENGETVYYLNGGTNIGAQVTKVTGYDYYYSVDKAADVETASNTFTFSMPKKAITLDGKYVAKQITVEKQFADPGVEVGKEYTEASPVYDLETLLIHDDTTATYGGEVSYAIKSGSSLPTGLSLVDNKIVGQVSDATTEKATVTFVVTGRNGDTVDVDLTMQIHNKEGEKESLNDKITYSNSTLNLNGTSVVIVGNPSDSSKCSIYPDDNQDKIADSNTPYLLNGASSYNLGGYKIIGYSNTTAAYDGDISITMKGGSVASIAGVQGTSTKRVTVNGHVKVYIEGGKLSNTTGKVYGTYYGIVENVTLEVTGGSHSYCDFTGALESTVTKNVYFKCGGTAKFTASSYTNNIVYMKAVEAATVAGDVNAYVGMKNSDYGFISGNAYTHFYGVHKSAVSGNANLVIDGYWNPYYNYGAYESSTITKNMNVDWKSGTLGGIYLVNRSTVTGDLVFEAENNANISGSSIYGLYLGTVNNLRMYIPEDVKGNVTSLYASNSTSDVINGNTYVNNKGDVQLGGEHVIEEDLSIRRLTVLADGNVTIADGVTVELDNGTNSNLMINKGAVLINDGTLNDLRTTSASNNTIYGTIENNGIMNLTMFNNVYSTVKNTGTLKCGAYIYIYGTIENAGTFETEYLYLQSGSKVINKETGTWNVKGRISPSGVIVNYGEFNQTYTGNYYNRLGNLYTTKELNLAGAVSNYTSYSNLYYPVTVAYPEHCVEKVTISGSYVGTSGVEGDTNQYTRAGSSFTVTLGEQLIQTVVLKNVTYGPNNSVATKQTNATWIGVAPAEPFEVSVNYDAAEGIETIVLDKTEDSITNTEDSKPLVVDKTYSYSSPLYDLSKIGITNDIEDGVVAYTVDSSSGLPKGMYLKDGRLYGTLKEATTEEQEIVFIIKGKNQTSASFTLTLGTVERCVPKWSAPEGLQTIVGKTLADVYLPDATNGNYSWPDATVAVGNKVTTLEDVELLFTPTDTTNYDWETAATKVGATYSDGVISCKVNVQVCGGVPTYEIPENVTAVYGQTLADVAIPSGDNDGVFTWNNTELSVGSVGSRYFTASYTPNDLEQYQKVTYVRIKVTVTKAVPTCPTLENVTLDCGDTLANIELPTAEDGKYQWITTTTTKPVDGMAYQAGYTPNDTRNYDWTQVEGWNSAWGCVVFPLTVNLNHEYVEDWSYNDYYHWHDCSKEDCSGVNAKDKHEWDKGTVITAATETTTGTMKHTCECGVTKTETIPVLTHTKHTYNSTWTSDANNHWHVCTFNGCTTKSDVAAHTWDAGKVTKEATVTTEGTKLYTCTVCKKTKTESIPATGDNSAEGPTTPAPGTVLPDNDKDADYVVIATVDNRPEVSYKFTNKNATKVVIPDTIVINGVTYKVTAIADDAFKNHKTLKSVKMGDNIRTIGKNAFYGCKKLTSVTVGKNVTTIGDSAFQNCTALKKITIPAKVATIGNKAFYGCKKLETVSMGAGVTTIGTSAFQNCIALKKITIPAKVKKIGAKAFYGCKKMTSITIKTTKLNTKNVGKQAFTKAGSSNYKKLTVKVPKKKLNAYKTMLKKCGLSSKAKVKK